MIVRDPASRARFLADRMGKVDLAQAEHLFSGLNSFEPGQQHEPHTHCDRDKLYVVLEGQGDVTLGDVTERIAAGDLALSPAGQVHALRNPGPGRLVVLVVMAPPPASRKG